MHHADTVGAAEMIAQIEVYAEDEAVFWKAPHMLREMARTGAAFADRN